MYLNDDYSMAGWICTCKRKNDDLELKCPYCGTEAKTKKPVQRMAFGQGSYPKVQRGDYECSKGTVYFRSKWEANYGLYLDFLIKQKEIKGWEFESKTFVFEKIQFGTRKYIPDFEVTNNDGTKEYHEVKGYMDSRSKTKLKRMEKYYPEVKLILIEESTYKSILRQLKGIVKFY